MLSGRRADKVVVSSSGPRWFYAGILLLGVVALLVLGGADVPGLAPIAAPAPAPLTVEFTDVDYGGSTASSGGAANEPDFRERFTKKEHMIPMRDGVKLFVAVYTPKLGADGLPPPPMPMLLSRTPYSCSPYGEDQYPTGRSRGEMQHYFEEGWIFVRCDVRGRYASEGLFVQMTPHIDEKLSSSDVDESSDTYDTIEWLVQNVPNNNGRAGIMGISCKSERFCAAVALSLTRKPRRPRLLLRRRHGRQSPGAEGRVAAGAHH